jgi:hypothetical protein
MPASPLETEAPISFHRALGDSNLWPPTWQLQASPCGTPVLYQPGPRPHLQRRDWESLGALEQLVSAVVFTKPH